MVDITLGMNYSQVKSAIESTPSGGTVNIVKGIYNLNPNTFGEIKPNSNITINGNDAEFRVYGANRDAALTNNTQRLTLYANGSGIKINNLTLRGRCAIYIAGSNHTFTKVIVDQGNQFTSYPDLKYNRIDNMYACFRMYAKVDNITFVECEAHYADHMGFVIFIADNGSASHTNTKYYRCKTFHCGSGWEQDGNNPWGRGFDFFESQGSLTGLYAEGCCAYDDLQSGYYNEGNYGGHSQSISGEIKNCHAENAGIRIAQASISGTPLIVGTRNYGVPTDIYGDGFYLTGNLTVTNCTSKNCLIGLTGEGITVNGFQDEGSYFGAATSSCRLNNFTSVAAKVYASVSLNGLSGSINVINYNSAGRAPIMFNWISLSAQREIAPKSYLNLGTNNGAVQSVEGPMMTTYCRFTRCNSTNSFTTSPSSLTIRVNNNSYGSFSNCVKGWYGSSPSSSGVSVSYNAALTYVSKSGCGEIINPPTPTCGEVDCAAKKKYICDNNGVGTWTDIPITDPDYIARCTEGCVGEEIKCVNGIEYKCSNGTFVATGKVCEQDTLLPYGTRPVLQKGTPAKIYARDFAKGGRGVAYSDSTTGNLGGSTYRSDSGDVDLVTWDSRMQDAETNKTVIAYTATGEWLKYPVQVVNCGKYKAEFRVSSGQNSQKIKVYVDDVLSATVTVPFTSADYATFTTVETNITVPASGTDRVIKLEFEGDMNLLWFQLTHVTDEACKSGEVIPDPVPGDREQHPYNTFSIRNEYGHECYVKGMWYDYGGEGKAYHNVATGLAGTYRRGIDAIEIYDDSIVTSTGEWIEYTFNVSETASYCFEFETKNNSSTSRIYASIVDGYGTDVQALFDVAIPISPYEYTKFYASAFGSNKYTLPAGSNVTIRLLFTGEFYFKAMKIASSDTVEHKVTVRPYKNVDINALPKSFAPYEFDYGGPGASYMDRTEERFTRKAVRDSDVDVVTVGKASGGVETIISNTMVGEWVQYTFLNTIGSESSTLKLQIECSTTEKLSKMFIVFLNEDSTKTYDANGQYSNTYIVSPPIVKDFTTLGTITIPITVYRGKNTMRIYFDDSISMGYLTFVS